MREIEDELLDNNPGAQKMNYKALIEWWESRRKRYNLIVFSVAICACFLIFFMLRKNFADDGTSIFLGISGGVFVSFGIGYNIVYCIGWTIDITLKYLGNIVLGEKTKIVFYWLLVLASIFPFVVVLGVVFYYRYYDPSSF